MAYFRLKERCGNHIGPPNETGNRKTYKAGDVVESQEDLVEKFPKKFVLLNSSDKDVIASASSPVIPIPKSSVSKSKETEEVKDMEEPLVSKVKTSKKKEVVVESEYGTDVTDQFPLAKEVKLQVFEKSKWFTVVDPDNDEVLNEKKLRKKNVKSFLKDYLPDEEDEDEDEEEYEEDEDDDEE